MIEQATELKWSRCPPKTEGLYLRVNAGHQVQLHQVVDFDFEGFKGLKILWGSGEGQRWIDMTNPKVSQWWWFGPIEKPPEEAFLGVIG